MAFVVAPASAQGSASWTLDCKGNGSGIVSWNWLVNGVPIAGAGGSVGCGGTTTADGPSAPPAAANGLSIVLSVSAGINTDTKTLTKSFSTGASFSVQLKGTSSDSGWAEFCYPDSRTCVRFHFHDSESAAFLLAG